MNVLEKPTCNKTSRCLSVTAVLVNYNTSVETFACVQSLQEAIQPNVNLQIVIVDNSDQVILPNIDGVIILRPGENLGLSPAWDLVFRKYGELSSDYFMFLNNDAIVAQNFFIELASGISKWGTNCAFGGRIYRLDQKKVIWSRGGSIDARKVIVTHDCLNVHRDLVQGGDFETGHISGCCIVIPTHLLNTIGGPDPRFFFRGEEWDMNYRLLFAGAKLIILDNMELWHAVNASHNQYAPDSLYLAYRAKVLFARKHHSTLWFMIWYAVGFIYAATISPRKFARISGQASWPTRKALVHAFIDGLRWKTIRPRSCLK